MHKITFMNDTGSQLGFTAFILETNLTTEILINPYIPHKIYKSTCRYRCMLYAAVFPSLADSTVVCDGSAVYIVGQEASPPHHTGGGVWRSCLSLSSLSIHHSQRPV